MPRCHPWTAREISASGGRRRAMDSPSSEFPWTGDAKPGRRCHCRRSHGSSRGSSFAIRAGGISHRYIEITRYVLAAVRADWPYSISLPTHGPRFHFPHRGRQKKSQSQSRTKRYARRYQIWTRRGCPKEVGRSRRRVAPWWAITSMMSAGDPGARTAYLNNAAFSSSTVSAHCASRLPPGAPATPMAPMTLLPALMGTPPPSSR